MKTQEEKLRLFYEAINKYASEQRLRIIYDTDKLGEQVLEQAESEALREAYDVLRRETAAVRGSVSGELAKRELELRRGLLIKRRDMENRVFDEAREVLSRFAESPEYADYLCTAARSAAKALGAAAAKSVIFLRSCDAGFGKELEKAFGSPCELEECESIALGGIRVSCPSKAVLLDFTLEAQLEEQREYFRESICELPDAGF